MGALPGLPVHLSADCGVLLNFHIHHSLSHRYHAGRAGTGFRPAWENREELRDEVDRGPQGKNMVPTDAISHIAGHGRLQLLRELWSLFAFVPRATHVCVHTHLGLCHLC